jgi:predicted membrane channel-forming protein YqfA (hemolysin III family)
MGGNLASIATLAGLFIHDPKIVYVIIGLGISWFFIQRARYAQSLIFLLMGVVYAYIIITYAIFTNLTDQMAFGLGSFYFLFSSIGVIFFLLNYKKFLGIKK